jgi:AraC family transcriptional regulator of adaptative response/methylated-DNA-[protein]-cysteine methyltransferase
MLIKDNNKIETYYQALLDRKQSFVGIFFVGVKQLLFFALLLVERENQN